MCLVLKIFTQLDRPIQPASRPACLSKFWKREREAKKEREIVPLYRLLPLGSKAISEFLKKGKSEKMQCFMQGRIITYRYSQKAPCFTISD